MANRLDGHGLCFIHFFILLVHLCQEEFIVTPAPSSVCVFPKFDEQRVSPSRFKLRLPGPLGGQVVARIVTAQLTKAFSKRVTNSIFTTPETSLQAIANQRLVSPIIPHVSWPWAVQSIEIEMRAVQRSERNDLWGIPAMQSPHEHIRNQTSSSIFVEG